MKKITLVFCLSLILIFQSFAQDNNQEKQTPEPNYRLASKYSPTNLGKLVHSTSVRPNWLKNGNRFWYQYKTTEGSNYYIVDADKRTKTKLFNNAKMAKWLTEITKDPYDAKHLPRFDFEFVKNETAIRFRVTSTEDVEVKETDTTSTDSTKSKKPKKKKPKMEKKVFHFEYMLGGNSLTVVDNKKKEKKEWEKWANVSPDSTLVLFSKNYNLYWMDKANFLKAVKNEKDTTIIEHQWTKDGEEHFGYGGSSRGENNETKEKNKNDRKRIRGYWSHDSKKFVYQKSDARHIKDLWVINSVTKERPTLETYKYHMAGEQEFYKSDILVFDIPSKEVTTVKLDTSVQKTIGIYNHKYKKSNTDEHKPTMLLSKKGDIYFNTVSRDRKKLDIHVADINTGEVKTIINEEFNTYIETRGKEIVLFNNESEILHWSERDGWGHFYLYDTNGNLKRQVTSGEFHIDSFEGINEKERLIYFTANGVSKNEDPYYDMGSTNETSY